MDVVPSAAPTKIITVVNKNIDNIYNPGKTIIGETMGTVITVDKNIVVPNKIVIDASTAPRQINRGGIICVFTAKITAYTKYDAGCNAYTASGTKAKVNHTIAMGKSFPIGTEVLIEGFGNTIFVNEDRGGAINNDHIDIFMDTKTDAFNFGVHYLKVQVIK